MRKVLVMARVVLAGSAVVEVPAKMEDVDIVACAREVLRSDPGRLLEDDRAEVEVTVHRVEDHKTLVEWECSCDLIGEHAPCGRLWKPYIQGRVMDALCACGHEEACCDSYEEVRRRLEAGR